MIVLGKSISHIKSLINYVYKEEKQAYVLDSDGIDLYSSQTILDDFKTFKNERLKNQFLSLVISPSEPNLDDKKMKEIVRDTLKELNLTSNQFLCVIHDNTEHKHAHLIVNRTSYFGKTFNDSYIGLKGIKIGQTIAKKHSLKSAYETRKENRSEKIHKKSSFHSSLDSKIKIIRELVDNIIRNPNTRSIDDVFNHLLENSVKIEITQHKNGSFGVMLEFDGQKIKASDVSRKITIISDNNNGYKANKLLQPILDRNDSSDLEKTRTEKEILADMSRNPQHAQQYLEELKYIASNGYFNSHSKSSSEKEEEEQKRNNRKNAKRTHQLGFKIQI